MSGHRPPGDPVRKLAAQCVRMARFIEKQRATLDAKIDELAAATGWTAEEARQWVERKVKHGR